MYVGVGSLQRWTDDRLTWNPRRFGNLRSISMSPDEVWTPGVNLDKRSTCAFLLLLSAPLRSTAARICISTESTVLPVYYSISVISAKVMFSSACVCL